MTPQSSAEHLSLVKPEPVSARLAGNSHFLPFAIPDIGDEEFAEVRSALSSGWITTGPKTKQFEAEFAKSVGARHAIAVNSCTAAMHLALEAIGLQPGDEVITTPYTFAATSEVIRYLGARPVFVDVDPGTFNIDISLIEGAISSRTKSNTPGAYSRPCRHESP